MPGQPLRFNLDLASAAAPDNHTNLFLIAPFLAFAEKPVTASVLSIQHVHLYGFSIDHFFGTSEERTFVPELQAIACVIERRPELTVVEAYYDGLHQALRLRTPQ
jgi:hypothetical protein